MWFFVLALLSGIGGWWTLAKNFRAEGPPPTGRHWLVSGSLGWADYRSTLIVGHSEAGLYLAAFPLFRPFHPPLLIPWPAIAARTRRGVWLMLRDTLEISGDRTVRLSLRVATTKAFESHLPPLAAKEER
jgi:hypothetical protein